MWSYGCSTAVGFSQNYNIFWVLPVLWQSYWLEDAKGRRRTALFVVVLCGPFRAQIASRLLIGVGHFSCLFVLVVALVVALDSYVAEGELR